MIKHEYNLYSKRLEAGLFYHTNNQIQSLSPLRGFITTVYTQVIESPPNLQNWVNKNFQSPPILGDLGGKIGRNEDR
jgi:hypothetical protein